jgi:hypothetical protein
MNIDGVEEPFRAAAEFYLQNQATKVEPARADAHGGANQGDTAEGAGVSVHGLIKPFVGAPVFAEKQASVDRMPNCTDGISNH